jgi:acetoin utilization protein AcuB
MKHPVLTVKPGDSVRHARELLERHRVNQLPVAIDDRLVGMVTDRDLRDVFPSVLDGPRHPDPRSRTDPSAVPVRDIMSASVLTLGPNAPVAAAARLMRHERIGAIPISEDGRLVGILTRSDILDAFTAISEEQRAL